MKTAGHPLKQFDLLKFRANEIHSRDHHLQSLNKGTILSLDTDIIREMYKGQNDLIHIPIPVSDESILILTLIRNQIFTTDFAVFTSSDPDHAIDYHPGLHYKGIVEGKPNSMVALSVFDNEIMAVITTDEGNFVLGAIQGNRDSDYIFYNDKDLDRTSDFICDTADDGLKYTEEQLKRVNHNRDAEDCVRLYLEIDDDIVTEKGGAIQATNFITSLYNQSFVLYSNDGITMMISQILAWTTNSPYTGSTAGAMLSSYQSLTGSFNGNLSCLVSYAASGGIAAGFNGICNANPDLSKSFCSISSTYLNVPTYSWSVMVVTHEIGHLLGSHHTHACVWNGNNTAIDGCGGAVEGSCALPGFPVEGGTIMSYCHLQSCGINLNLGFGPQPGNIIRNTVNAQGNCLTPGGPPPPPPPLSYCTSKGTNTNHEFIKKVEFASISNLSGNNNGYGNYTSLSTSLTAGATYTIILTPGFPAASHNESWRVWIDYNNDHDWEDEGEMVGQGTGTVPVNVTFTIPTANATMTTTMRVSMQYKAFPPVCGTFTYGEVEDYSIMIAGTLIPGCADGIQNQGETGVDCGGPCSPCPPVPSCTDGIQNQGETGIDCGGPCSPCAPPSNTLLLAAYFETGWDNWIDGGMDVERVKSSYSWEGAYSIRLADNEGIQSAMTSPAFNLSMATGVQISFHFYAVSMEPGEDFWVQYRNGTGNWRTIGTYAKGSNFNNNTFYVSTITVSDFIPTTAGSFRIQCDAGDNTDQVFIDAVIITSFNGSSIMEPGIVIKELQGVAVDSAISDLHEPEKNLSVYPNPVEEILNVSFTGNIESIKIFSLDGKEAGAQIMNDSKTQLDINHLSPGIYFLSVLSEGKWYPVKFSKM